MKQKIFGGIAVLAIAAIAVFNVSLSSKSSNLSGVSLANVEVLAYGETNSGCSTTTSYERRQELCGSGSKKTDLSITCYSRSSGNFSSYKKGCIVRGTGCSGSVDTDSVETISC